MDLNGTDKPSKQNTCNEVRLEEAENSSVAEEISHFLYHLEVHYRIHHATGRTPETDESTPPYHNIFKIYFNIIIPSTLRSPSFLFTGYQWLFPWGQGGRGVKLTTHLHLVSRS
jgi:hypothetical protein